MPLFTRELNDLADRIGRNDLTVRLHTAAPTNASPTNGRVNSGGGLFVSGANLPASGISDAANGDITNDNDIDFGTAVAAAGTVTHWSAYRVSDPVAFGPLPSTVIATGDSFKINAQTLDFNGSTS